MEPILFVASQSIRPVGAFVERVGKSLHLSERSETNGPLPLVYGGWLFEELSRELGDEAVGLRIGAATRFEDAPLGGHVGGSLTVGAALDGAARVSARYCGGHRLWVTRHGNDVWLRRRHSDTLRRGRRQANDFALQLLIDLLRRGAGPHWRPAALHLEGPPPGHAEELAALAARSTHFGADADCLVFPASVLALTLPRRPRHVEPATTPLPDRDLVDSVRETICCLLELGELSLPNVAEAAGTSARSLQRRLAAFGIRFSRLVDEARFRAASQRLHDPAVQIIDVAVELGYTDAANFTRAFRRWSGVSPLAFRRAVA